MTYEDCLKFEIKDLKIPSDCHEMTEKYKGECMGICGQACLAVITGQTITSVMQIWKRFGLEWRGWSGWNQLKQYLKRSGFSVKQVNGKPDYDPSLIYIARVQWLGDGDNKDKPFFGWGHWSQASAYTHFIVITPKQFFCNESGIFTMDHLQPYLNHGDGEITSHMAIGKMNTEK